MRLETMMDLYTHELKDLYNAESRLLNALPKLAAKASSSELRSAIESHLKETRTHHDRLEQIFRGLDARPTGEQCEAMDGLLREADEILQADGAGAAIDAGIIAMANRIEHYEIAGYGAARTHARDLGRDSDADLLDQTLQEEAAADEALTNLATGRVNPDACNC
ncbi:MAG: ferritin-like domain-containing protein [Phycisphaerales bacterium JB039]